MLRLFRSACSRSLLMDAGERVALTVEVAGEDDDEGLAALEDLTAQLREALLSETDADAVDRVVSSEAEAGTRGTLHETGVLLVTLVSNRAVTESIVEFVRAWG